MRGVSILLAQGAFLLALNVGTQARAAAAPGVDALAVEKAAAVSLLKHRAEAQVAIAASDRLFAVYLNAASLAEGARVMPRIQAVLNGLLDRYGIREVLVADRSGAFLTRAGNFDRTVASLDPKADARLAAAFAAEARRATSLQKDLRLDIVAPSIVRGQPEFALAARQDLTSYRKVLSQGVAQNRFVVLADAKGVVLADSRHGGAGTTAILADLTLDALRKALRGASAGEVTARELRYRVSIRPAGAWSVVAVESIPAPRRCYAEGARLCG